MTPVPASDPPEGDTPIRVIHQQVVPDPGQGPKPDDELLIRRAFERSAYEGCDLIFRRYYHPLCNHAVRLVYNKALAEDIVADLFQNCWQKRVFERIELSYRSYLYRAVRQNCLLYLQREAGRTVSTDQLALPWYGRAKPDSVLA